MTDWHYAADGRTRQGPVGAAELVERYRRGELTPTALVWHEGMEDWRPLSEMFGELGMVPDPRIPPPPPLPPAAPPPTPGAAPGYSPPAGSPPRKGMSGCLIAIIVAAVLAIPMIAILAAIALPAYNNYRVRAAEGACLAETKAYANTATAALANGEVPPAPPRRACVEADSASSEQVTITAIPREPGKAPVTCELQSATCVLAPAESR